MATPVKRLRGRNAEIIEQNIFRLSEALRKCLEDLERTAETGPDGIRQTATIGIVANEISGVMRELEGIGRE